MTVSLLKKLHQDAHEIFQAGLTCVDPAAAIQKYVKRADDRLSICGSHWDLSKVGRLLIIGAGKASASMAAAMEDILDDRITGGCVIVKYGHGANLSRISLVEAGKGRAQRDRRRMLRLC